MECSPNSENPQKVNDYWTEAVVRQAGAEVKIRVDGLPLSELLPLIEQALKGAGYVFDGILDITEEE